MLRLQQMSSQRLREGNWQKRWTCPGRNLRFIHTLDNPNLSHKAPLISLFAHAFWTTESPTQAPLSGLSRLLCLVRTFLQTQWRPSVPAPELWSWKRALSPARALKALRAHKAHTSPRARLTLKALRAHKAHTSSEGRHLSYPASSLAPEDSWEADETSLLHQISTPTEPSRSYLAFRSVFFPHEGR